MRTGHPDRLWMVGGAIGAVALLAISWFFFIGPKNSQTTGLREQTAAAEVNLASLGHKLSDLRQQNNLLPQYLAQLARDRQALPTTSGLSDFLREMQTAGDSEGISVSALIVGVPSQVTAAGAALYSLPITLTAMGTSVALAEFLDQLQQVQPRAVLIGTVEAVPGTDGGTLAGAVTLTLSMQVFVAPTTLTAATPQPTKTK